MSSNSWDSWELKLLSIKDGVEKYSYRGWVLYYRGGIWYVVIMEHYLIQYQEPMMVATN